MIVLDSSVILATAFDEPGKIDLSELFETAAISSVNFGEVVSKLLERGYDNDGFDYFIDRMTPICHPLTTAQALQAGRWRTATRQLGLSMGDRCCLALGLDLGAEVYTADRAWAGLELGVKIRVTR